MIELLGLSELINEPLLKDVFFKNDQTFGFSHRNLCVALQTAGIK